MKKARILDRVIGRVMAWTARGNVVIQFTEADSRFKHAKFVLKRAHWCNMIANENRERSYSTPRCSRLRAWDTKMRLDQLEASL